MSAPVTTGGCLCGAVRYEADVPPSRTSYCHCRMCQRHSGSAVLVYTNFPTASFRFVKGRPRLYRSSDIAERGFCADCGSPLTFQYFARQERIAIAVGSLDHPEAAQPEVHWGVESQLSWLAIADDLPRRRSDEDDLVAGAVTPRAGVAGALPASRGRATGWP